MEFDLLLDNYAELLICHGLNVQEGQVVNVQGEMIHRDFIFRCVKAAYKRGAKYVGIDFIDPFLTRLRLVQSNSPEYLKYVPEFITKKFNDMVDHSETILRILGSEAPDVLVDLNPKLVNSLNFNYRNSIRRFYDEGIGRSKVQWNLGAAATVAWAKKVFPELSDSEALHKLWGHIFSICRVDQPNFLDLWSNHNAKLKARAKALTELKIKELHFEGPGTDLKVGLSNQALFIGGGDKTPQGIAYEPNIPTEECFTTPDWRKTEGHVRTTRPFFMNGVLVKGLRLVFKAGELVEFSAEEGQQTFEEYISSDAGAKHLGEVALVGIDSPVYQSGTVFRETLFDENAACHIAIGSAYRFCLQGGPVMSDEELDKLGCNFSNVHSDMMISSEEVDVTATTYGGERIVLLHQGQWVE